MAVMAIHRLIEGGTGASVAKHLAYLLKMECDGISALPTTDKRKNISGYYGAKPINNKRKI